MCRDDLMLDNERGGALFGLRYLHGVDLTNVSQTRTMRA